MARSMRCPSACAGVHGLSYRRAQRARTHRGADAAGPAVGLCGRDQRLSQDRAGLAHGGAPRQPGHRRSKCKTTADSPHRPCTDAVRTARRAGCPAATCRPSGRRCGRAAATPAQRRRIGANAGDAADGDFVDVDWLERRCRRRRRAAAGAVPRPRRLVVEPLRAGLRRRRARRARLALRGAALSRLLGRAQSARRAPTTRATSRRSAGLLERAAARAHRGPLARGRRLARRQRAAALGRRSRRAARRARVRAVAAVSSPLDLAAGGHAIGRGFNRLVYTRMFLRSMKPKALAKLAQHPGLFDRARLLGGARPVRVRQRLHRAAARLSRHRRLLAARARPSRTCARSASRRWCSTRATTRSCRPRACRAQHEVGAATSRCGSRGTAAMSAFRPGASRVM